MNLQQGTKDLKIEETSWTLAGKRMQGDRLRTPMLC